jgi:hypothetical protein
MGVFKSWGSERWLSSKAYRNQASGSIDNPLGLDKSLRSHLTGAGSGPFSALPQLLYAPDSALFMFLGRRILTGQIWAYPSGYFFLQPSGRQCPDREPRKAI